MEVPRAVVTHAVHEYGGCGAHPVATAVGAILLDPLPQQWILEITAEALHVEAERRRNVEEDAPVKWRVVPVECIVHFPKTALAPRRFRADRHEFRSRVSPLIREMTERIRQPVAQGVSQPLEHLA